MTNTISPVQSSPVQSSPVQSSPVQSSPVQSKRLAVIVPVYKVEKYLEKCLDSIINQTYKNLQIICVDDGSPDNCGAILDEYAKKDERIVVIHKENGGLSSARNAGLDYLMTSAKVGGHELPEFVAFVDSDDYLDLSTYESCLSHFTSDIDVLEFGFEHVYESSEYTGRDRFIDAGLLGLEGKKDLTDDILLSTLNFAWSKIFRSKIIFENNLRFPIGMFMEDTYFRTVYMVHCVKIYFNNKHYYKYLKGRESSITGEFNIMETTVCKDYIIICFLIRDYLKSVNLYEIKKNVFWTIFYRMFFEAISLKHSKEVDEFLYSEAKRLLSEEQYNGSNALEYRYNSLIYSGLAKEATIYSFGNLIKIKHRIDFDKYYILGIPFLRVSYTKEAKYVSIFGLIKFKSK